MTSRALRLCTDNIRNHPPMRPRAVWHDMRLAGTIAADLYGFQELWSPNYRAALFARFRPRAWGRRVTNGPAGTAAVWRLSRFRARWTFNHALHGPIKGVCGQRKMTGAVLTDVETGEDLTVIVVHPLPSAWSRRFPEPFRRELAAVWTDAISDELRTFVAHHVRMGRRVVVLGDFNARRRRVEDALGATIAGAPVQVCSADPDDPDHIVLVGAWRVVESARAVPGHRSDHAPVVVAAVPA